ncbi:hypothetical protein CDAR_28771 [Caerostris darwini]|uniref:Uncharacterized protein n=1 Tax=Caerostris darwini TaxID=1538125 RepID=A0AAV4Q366_9ARAC|nr:hypothetical protein CDAR_28771 [Caerostris darwini]
MDLIQLGTDIGYSLCTGRSHRFDTGQSLNCLYTAMDLTQYTDMSLKQLRTGMGLKKPGTDTRHSHGSVKGHSVDPDMDLIQPWNSLNRTVPLKARAPDTAIDLPQDTA